MKIKDGFLLKSVAGQQVVVPVGAASVDFNAMITLNETGAFLWEKLEQETDEAALVEAILAEYEVEPARAAESVSKFLGKLRDAGLLEEAPTA